MKKLLIAHLTIILAAASYFFPLTHAFWTFLDHHTFHLLHPLIEKSPLAQHFWAFTGHRMMDYVHDVIMLSFFGLYIFKSPLKERLKRVAELLFAAALIAFVIVVINQNLIHAHFQPKRSSPTMVYENVTQLSEKISLFRVKDSSKTSFPGDHATTAILFLGIVWITMGRRVGIATIFYAIFFCLPRLISGAHWLTDDLLGSGLIALFFLSWAYFTPIASLFISLFEFFLGFFGKACYKVIPWMENRTTKNSSTTVAKSESSSQSNG